MRELFPRCRQVIPSPQKPDSRADFPKGSRSDSVMQICSRHPFLMVGDLNTGNQQADKTSTGAKYHCAEWFDCLSSKDGHSSIFGTGPTEITRANGRGASPRTDSASTTRSAILSSLAGFSQFAGTTMRRAMSTSATTARCWSLWPKRRSQHSLTEHGPAAYGLPRYNGHAVAGVAKRQVATRPVRAAVTGAASSPKARR